MPYRRYAWIDIDTEAIAHNVAAIRARIPERTLLMAVVKADGYGHGAIETARAALSAGADRFGVATVEEALELRDAGFTQPVQLLSEPPIDAVDLLVERDIIPALTTREFAQALSRAAVAAGGTARFHLKIDSGMGRIGVRAAEAPAFATWLKELPALDMEGAFTHFATADAPGDPGFDLQLERFSAAIAELRTEGLRPRIVHAANSAATLLHSETHFDMVRPGIVIYGLHPSDATYGAIDLVSAMSIKARVSYVKTIPAGEGVSYGLTWHSSATTTIATVPLGYADGVHRTLSNKMQVLLGGRRCRQIGRVCMDQLMVEVPGGMHVSTGDEVVLVGSQGGESISMDELAERAGTINYELACGFSRRLTRYYR